MMDNDDAWMYYHDEAAEQIDLNSVLNATESICSALGFKLGKSWEAYANELLKMPWTSIYLASLELDDPKTLLPGGGGEEGRIGRLRSLEEMPPKYAIFSTVLSKTVYKEMRVF